MASSTTAARSPPGQWRLLAPALGVWAITAILTAHPGAGALAAVVAGSTGAVLVLILLGMRARDPHESANEGPHETLRAALRAATRRSSGGRRAVIGALLLFAGMMLVVGTRIAEFESVRADPEFAHAAQSGRVIHAEGRLQGFLQHDAASGRAWARASVRTSSGDLPVVLWLDPDVARAFAADGASPAAPGQGIRVGGAPVTLEPSSSAAYGIRVEWLEQDEARAASLETRLGNGAAELRGSLRSAAEQHGQAELVPGLAVGDTALVGQDVDRAMLATSLTHLVAVSGANCALVTSAIVWAASRLGAGRRLRTLLAAGALAGFVLVVGPDPSVQRAAVMATVVLVSSYGGKRSVALAALGAAILVLLAADPWQATQPGFVLSVVATGGILVFVPEVMRALRRATAVLLPRPAPTWITLPVSVALTAQVVCAPFLLLLQPDLTAVGVLANVLAAPAAPFGTGLGLLALVLAPISDVLGAAAVWVAALPARWIVATAEVTAQLPLAHWPWPGGWGGAALLAAVELALLLVWLLATRRIGHRLVAGSGPRPWLPPRPLPLPARVCVAVLGTCALAVFSWPTVVGPAVERGLTPEDWRVVACDVGQGDAILIRSPDDPQDVVLVDTGDDERLLDDCMARFGVDRIALAVLTHDDRDHIGALGGMLGRIDRALIAPDTAEDAAVSRQLVSDLRGAGVPYAIGAAGDAGSLSPSDGTGDASSVHGVAWEVLAPAAGATPAGRNEASLVLRVIVADTTLLLLGDTGETEQHLLRRTGADLRADIVKVAHHGSRDQDPALYRDAGAQLALISVGADNGYGHPTADTLATLDAVGTAGLRTDELGSIAITGASTDLGVWSTRGQVGRSR